MWEAAFKIKGEIIRVKILSKIYRKKKDKLLLKRCVIFKKIENKLIKR